MALAVTSAPGSAGTETKLHSNSSHRVKRCPPRGRLGSSGSPSIGSKPTETALTKPDFTSPRTSSAFAEMPAGTKVTLAAIASLSARMSSALATGANGSCCHSMIGLAR